MPSSSPLDKQHRPAAAGQRRFQGRVGGVEGAQAGNDFRARGRRRFPGSTSTDKRWWGRRRRQRPPLSGRRSIAEPAARRHPSPPWSARFSLRSAGQAWAALPRYLPISSGDRHVNGFGPGVVGHLVLEVLEAEHVVGLLQDPYRLEAWPVRGRPGRCPPGTPAGVLRLGGRGRSGREVRKSPSRPKARAARRRGESFFLGRQNCPGRVGPSVSPRRPCYAGIPRQVTDGRGIVLAFHAIARHESHAARASAADQRGGGRRPRWDRPDKRRRSGRRSCWGPSCRSGCRGQGPRQRPHCDRRRGCYRSRFPTPRRSPSPMVKSAAGTAPCPNTC